MNIRPKTKRRVTYLFVGAFLAASAFATVYAIRMHQINARIESAHTEGMDAFARGDYDTAYNRLSAYIHKRKKDPEAMLALAISRSKVPSLDGSDITESVNIFNKYLTMAPEDSASVLRAKHQLLEIEQQFQPYAGQAISLANSLLKDNPNDIVALRALAEIHFVEKHYKDSLDAAVKFTSLQPTDLELQRLTLALMQLTSQPPGDLRTRADHLAEANPSDPRFIVLQAFAISYSGGPNQTAEQREHDEADENRLLLAAAMKDPPDAQFVRLTADFLDRLQQFDAAQDLLSRACAKMNNPDVLSMMVQRLWENDKFAEVIDRLKDLNWPSPKTDAELIAFDAMSLHSLNQKSQAVKLVAALVARPDEPEAFAWATALKVKFDSGKPDPKAQLALLQQAAQYDSGNPFIQTMLGDAYASVGETDLALQEWRQASGRVPGWAYPHIRTASLLAGIGQGAGGEAEQATQGINKSAGAPDALKIQADIAKAQVQFAHVQSTNDPDEVQALLDDVTELQRQVPGEPTTLPIYAALLARAGQRDKAIQVIQGAQIQHDENGQEVLLKLAVVSRDAKLGLEQNIYQSVQRQFGMTPPLALAQASDLLAQGRGPDGLVLLQTAAGAATAQKPVWDRTLCLYREAAHDPGALAAWKQLGDAYPNDLAVQSAIVVNQNSAWSDRDFMSRSIDRLKALTGDDAVTWKLGRARWLLDSPDEQKDASAAVVLLSEVIGHSPGQYRPHMFLATAYEKLADTAATSKDRQTNLTNAAGEWKQASDLMANSPEILYNQLRVLSLAGRAQDAAAVFDKLAAIPKIPPDLALRAATVMLTAGDLGRAQKLLDDYPHPSQQILHDATLAMVDRRQGKIDAATQLYLGMVDAEHLDLATITQAVDFFGATHNPTQAQKFLTRLLTLNLPAGQAELIEAGYDEQYISINSAAVQYAAAARADANSLSLATSQIAFLIRNQRWTEAKTSIDAALVHWPSDPQLLAYKTIATKLAAIPASSAMASFMAGVAGDPQNAALRDAADILAAETSPDDSLKKLTALTAKYPDSEPLADLTIARMISANRPSDAALAATEAMKRFASSDHAAEIATRAAIQAGRWDDAIAAAHQWRARGLADPMLADVVIAAASMFSGKSHDAVTALAPYIIDAQKNPEQYVDLIAEYSEALIRDGRETDAAALLHPLAEKSDLFRYKWLDIAGSSHRDADSTLAWIERVHPLLPVDSFPEQNALARTYFAVGQKYANDKAYERARDTLKPFVGKPVMDKAAMLLLGKAAAASNDLALAEQMPRAVLANEPKDIAAMNDLAEVLSRSFDAAPLMEAEKLARFVCAATDDDPVYLNTLARILRKQGHSDEAIADLEKARGKTPTDPTILIGLADAYARSGQLDKAAKCLDQLETASTASTRPSPMVQAELQDARDLVGKTTGSTLGEAR